MKATSTTTKTTRTNRLPRATAVRAPTYPPATLATAITAPIFHMTWPPGTKTVRAPRLVAKFAILALALASRKA